MIQTTIRVPEKLYEKIKKQAKESGMTINGYILMWLNQKVQNASK